MPPFLCLSGFLAGSFGLKITDRKPAGFRDLLQSLNIIGGVIGGLVAVGDPGKGLADLLYWESLFNSLDSSL